MNMKRKKKEEKKTKQNTNLFLSPLTNTSVMFQSFTVTSASRLASVKHFVPHFERLALRWHKARSLQLKNKKKKLYN